MKTPQPRRRFLQQSTLALSGGLALSTTPSGYANQTSNLSTDKIRYCLNASTINGNVIDVVEQIRIAEKAGYQGIEMWLPHIKKYTDAGGKLEDLKKRLVDSGLRLESAIAFGQWIAEDESVRTKGLEQSGMDMEVVQALGGTRIAAPPAGATQGAALNLDAVTERYVALLELGKKFHVVPQLEVWGFSKNLSRLCEVLYVTSASQHPDACVLPDVYHLYKGGSNFLDLKFLAGERVHVFHMNDYPAQPTRDKIGDADRVYPLEGIAPIAQILQTVVHSGFAGVLSLELFNRSYWQQDPNEVAKTGLEKMKAAVSLLNR